MDAQGLMELEQVYTQFIRRMAAKWHEFSTEGISKTRVMILERLEQKGPAKLSELADALYMTCGAITGVSDKLVDDGCAEKVRDGHDRRVVYLVITAKGREELQHMLAVKKQFVESLFRDLPDEDADHLIRIYKRMLENWDQQQKG